MLKLKICGVTTLKDARICTDEGADYIGFILTESPRQISAKRAMSIASKLPKHVKSIAVFCDQDLDIVKPVAGYFDNVQLHGKESPEYVNLIGDNIIKRFDIPTEDYMRYKNVFAYMIDVSRVPLKFVLSVKKRGPVFVSGGLDPSNVARIVKATTPFAVDICRATESSPGKKDKKRIRELVEAIPR